MTRVATALFSILAALWLTAPPALAFGQPVHSAHPRLLLERGTIARLVAKKNAGDVSWRALKSQADTLASYAIFPYEYPTHTEEPPRTIFYDYQGSGWFNAAMPLALAYRMTGDRKYSAKLIELADAMIAAQSDPVNRPPNGPLELDSYYPTRYLGPVIAVIYDWCYDQLDTSRKRKIVALMNAYFDDLRMNAYQVNDPPDGNYFPNHMVAVGLMGYASFGDNPRARTMIDWARARLDDTPSSLLGANDKPVEWVTEAFAGGVKPAIATDFNGPNIEGAPWKGGFDFQGWAYGTQTLDAVIDYLLAVRSATGEDLLSSHIDWFEQIFLALRHGLMPDRFKIVPSGDWGSDWGAVINRSLPVRLAFVLAGVPTYGPGAQHFAYTEIPAHSPYPVDFPDYGYQGVDQQAPWEEFLFGDAGRASTAAILPVSYSGFDPRETAKSRAIPYFYLRSDWSANATWAFLHMGAAWYNDHAHADAGTLIITHGRDQLLVDASNWKWAPGTGEGIYGSSFDETAGPASAANTLYFNDFGDFQRSADAVSGQPYYCGGQGIWGKDDVLAADQTASYSFLRSNLVTAYDRSGDPADQQGRKLAAYLRTVVYLRPADLFLVYDQVAAVNSTNRLGQYRKLLRWHLPRKPVVGSNLVNVDHGTSRLYLRTLLPQSASIAVVDETANKDPCDGSNPRCTTYFQAGIDITSHTWRLEVSDKGNPLTIEFLTLLQPGPTSRPPMTGTAMTSRDGKMRGARIMQPSGTKTALNIVLINRGLSPVAGTSYDFSGPPATHTLGGMIANARYKVSAANSAITVAEDPGGTVVASAQGVVQFTR